MARRDRGRALDIALIVLAFASVVIFTLDVGVEVASIDLRILQAADLLLVIIYGAIFVTKGWLDEHPARWFRRHAWLAVALFPVTIPLFVAAPYFLVFQVLVLMLRIAKAIDRALHLHIVMGLSERYRARIVEEVTQPLLMDLARTLEEAVTSQDYAAAMGERLRARQDLVEAAVRRGIAASPRFARISQVAPVQRVIDETVREVVVAAHAALTGPEINLIIRESFQDAFVKLRVGIMEPKWPHRGVGLKDAASMVIHGARLPREEPPAPSVV